MRIPSVTISNILSIEDATLHFEDNGLILLEGWNFDDGRANGAGKTAIFNALCFGLYGKVPRDVTVSELLREGTKRGFVEVPVQVGSDIYTVKRERPNKVTFYKNGVEEPMTQSSFESKIQLNYNQFLASMYTAQSNREKFLFKNDTAKKEFLLQLMNLNEFSACKKEAEKEVSSLDKDITDLKTKLEAAKSRIQAYSESLKNPVSLQADIDKCTTNIDDYTFKIADLQLVKQPDVSKYDSLEDNLKKKQSKLHDARAKKSVLHDQYRKLMAMDKPFIEKDPDANCPHCSGALNINGMSVVKADDLSAVKKQHQEHLTQIKDEAKQIKLQIDDFDAILVKESEYNALSEKIREKKRIEYADYNAATAKISDLRARIGSLSVHRSACHAAIQEHNVNLEKIAKLNLTVDELTSSIQLKETTVELYEGVFSMCSPTGAPAYIMDSIVDSFNDSVEKYVDMVWPNASYILNSYKEKSDGDTIAKFSEVLMMNGKQKSVGSLSGGELRALSLAVDFAIIDVLSKQFGIRLNPIIMDEPFEGLDAAGREVVINLLERLSADRQIWVVDHMNESKGLFSKILRVEKRSGVTKIVT